LNMRRLHHLFTPIFASIFLFIFLVATPTTHAVDLPFFPGAAGVDQPKTMQDYAKEFCDKRSGDLMNLETWFSGKCAPGTDNLSGEGVGFVDIIQLQTYEWMVGPQYDNFLDGIIKTLKLFQALKDTFAQNPSGIYQANTSSLGNQGLVASLAKITTGLVTSKPASSSEYVEYLSSNLQKHNITSEVYAAGPGYGFTALSPILPLWKAFRNVAYLLFALGFVLYGVMIMFRVRIDAKTAATVQLAIPKLIITLLLITFSYAIVGLLIDISTIASAMVINILAMGGILNTDFLNWGPLMASGQSPLGSVGSFIVNWLLVMMTTPFIFFNLIIGGFIGVIVSVIAGAVSFFSGIGSVFSVIILLAVGISYIKLILKLFEAYFSIIVNLIFAPLILLGNIMPGSNAVSSWLLNIFGNLAVFPTASFFLVLSYALMAQPLLSLAAFIPAIGGAVSGGIESLIGVNNLSTLGALWSPPMTTPNWGDAAGGGAVGNIGSLMLATVGFGFLLMASKYVDMVRDALKVPPFKYGAAITEALKFGVSGNESWAKKGYAGLPGGWGSGARKAYPGSPSVEPSLQIGGIDTGLNLKKTADGK
jgi:hypothetical protein